MQFQFLTSGIDKSLAYPGTYVMPLVVLSVLVASFAAYSALAITEKLTRVSDHYIKQTWLWIGALAMGVGVWSMHFVGMLAFKLPFTVNYDPWVTLISLLPAFIASRIALGFMTKETIGFWRLNLGGILMGVGIGTMHYTGMAAMLMNAQMYYDPLLFILSILVAHILATFALYIKFAFGAASRINVNRDRIISSLIMGCAVAGMHYTGMKAAFYFPGKDVLCLSGTPGPAPFFSGMDPSSLAFIVTSVAAIFIAVVLIGTFGYHEKVMTVRFPLSFQISMGFATLLVFFILGQTIILTHVNNMNRQFSYAQNGERSVLNAMRLETLLADREKRQGSLGADITEDKTFKEIMAKIRDLVSGDPGRQAALGRVEASVGKAIQTAQASKGAVSGMGDIREQIDNFTADTVASNKSLYQNVIQSAERTKKMNYVLLGVSIAISVVLVTVLLRGIFNSLFKLVTFSQRMKDGDLESRIEVTSADEFNILAGTFEEMRVKLKASYAELRVSKDYLERILQSAGESIMITNLAGEIEYVNQAFEAMTGFKRQEVMGKTPRIFKSGLQDKEFYRDLWDTIRDGKTWFGTLVNKKRDGSLYNVEETIAPIFDNDRIVSYVAIFRDVTERNKMEQELKNMFSNLQKVHEDLKQAQMQLLQSEKMASIGQLAAGVAHEINNPMGFISNNIEVLDRYMLDYHKILGMFEDLKKNIERGNLEGAKAAVGEMARLEKEIDLNYLIRDSGKLLRDTQKGIERIRKIVMDLRTFAREDNDLTEAVKIEEVIDSILSIVHSELRYKAELKKDYGDTPMVNCNAQRLGQVFINLLVNAAQAIEGKGTIGVKTYSQDKYVCVDVSDTGRGIAPENLKKIFEPFFTTKPVGQGTGLGLSVSYQIIKKQGGDIKVRSEAGKGATFTVMLPRTCAEGTGRDG